MAGKPWANWTGWKVPSPAIASVESGPRADDTLIAAEEAAFIEAVMEYIPPQVQIGVTPDLAQTVLPHDPHINMKMESRPPCELTRSQFFEPVGNSSQQDVQPKLSHTQVQQYEEQFKMMEEKEKLDQVMSLSPSGGSCPSGVKHRSEPYPMQHGSKMILSDKFSVNACADVPHDGEVIKGAIRDAIVPVTMTMPLLQPCVAQGGPVPEACSLAPSAVPEALVNGQCVVNPNLPQMPGPMAPITAVVPHWKVPILPPRADHTWGPAVQPVAIVADVLQPQLQTTSHVVVEPSATTQSTGPRSIRRWKAGLQSPVPRIPMKFVQLMQHGFEAAPFHLIFAVLGEFAYGYRALGDQSMHLILRLICLCPQAWNDVESFVLVAFRSAMDMLARPTCFCSAQKIFIVFISGCTGTGIPVSAFIQAMKQIQTRYPSVHMIPIRMFSYECNEAAVLFAKRTWDYFNHSIEITHNDDIWNFEDDVNSIMRKYQGCLFVATAGTECTDTTWANKKEIPPNSSRLHAGLSRTAFHWHRGLQALAEIMGTQSIACIHEYPRCQDPRDEQTMNAMFGAPKPSKASEWFNCAERTRWWRTNPQLVNVKRISPPGSQDTGKNVSKQLDMSGRMWAPTGSAVTSGMTQPVVLRRYFPRLLDNKLKGYKMTEYEKLTVDSLQTILPGIPDSRRYAGPMFFLHHLGANQSGLHQSILEFYPCFKVIDPQGSPVDAQHHDAAECGVHRLCGNCGANIRLLGGAWHLPMATEVLFQVIDAAVAQWLDIKVATWWDWSNYPSHYCDDFCTLNPVQMSPAAVANSMDAI